MMVPGRCDHRRKHTHTQFVIIIIVSGSRSAIESNWDQACLGFLSELSPMIVFCITFRTINNKTSHCSAVVVPFPL